MFPRRAWVGLTLLHRSREDLHRDATVAAAREAGLPLVALGQVQMHLRSRQPLHDTLAGIRSHQPVSRCGYALAGNAERHLRTRMRLASLYPPEALAQTLAVARRCGFAGRAALRVSGRDRAAGPHACHLPAPGDAGRRRAPLPQGVPEAIATQIEKELGLIRDLQYEAYFLTVYDIVQFARGQGILCQGRGSAANSAVCYCLGITEVDPIRGHALFERFISKERNEPPDIDVDFEHQRREEVIQYIYDKYGRDRARADRGGHLLSTAQRAARHRRALGVDNGVIDAVARAHQWWDGKKEMLRTLGACGLDRTRAWRGNGLAGADADGLSAPPVAAPGGFVISRGKLSRLVPIENAAMPDRSVVQWDKDDLDARLLLKVDVLALGMLSALRRTLELAGQRRGAPLRLQDIPPGDDPTYDMICDADTIGVFQIESRAQMSMLPGCGRASITTWWYRWPSCGRGRSRAAWCIPTCADARARKTKPIPEKVRDVLSRTMGVPIFQEQVMQIAVVAAGFTPGDADQLRRPWPPGSAGRRRQIPRQAGRRPAGPRLHAGLRRSAVPPDRGLRRIRLSRKPRRQLRAAGLRQLLAQAPRARGLPGRPAQFPAHGLLRAGPAGAGRPPPRRARAAARRDAQRLGLGAGNAAARGLATPRRAHPHAPPAGEPRPAVRLGLSLVQGLREEAARRIEAARAQAPYTDTGDLARRAALTRHELNALAAGDALRTLAGHRRQASWEAAASASSRDLLRHAAIHDVQAPALSAPDEGQSVAADYRSVGLTLRSHPVALLRPQLAARNFQPAAVLNTYPHRRVARACGIVTVRQRPQTAKGVIFVTLEDETGPVNVVVRTELIERQRRELLGSSLLGVYGAWQNVDGVRHLIAQRLVDMSELLGGLSTQSRNFH